MAEEVEPALVCAQKDERGRAVDHQTDQALVVRPDLDARHLDVPVYHFSRLFIACARLRTASSGLFVFCLLLFR